MLVGADVVPEMLVEARRRVPTAELVVLDGHALAFGDGSFDAAFCASAIYQMPEPQRVVGEMVRILRPGGVLALSVFEADDPHWSGLAQLYREFLPPLPADAEPQDRELLEVLLASADLDQITIGTRQLDVAYRDASEWLASASSHGERRAFEPMGTDRYAMFARRLPAALEPARGDDVRLHWRPWAIYALGMRPDHLRDRGRPHQAR